MDSHSIKTHLRVFRVINSHDAGPGSLRQAFLDANLQVLNAIEDKILPSGGSSLTSNRIVISSRVIKPIKLTSGEIEVTSNIILKCHVKPHLMILTSNSRIFNVSAEYFEIEGNFILKKGSSNKGGSIYSTGKNLVLKNVHFCHNFASQMGGSVYTTGHLSLNQCSFKKNKAGQQGGAIWVGDGATIYQTDISYNKVLNLDVSSSGGGIFKDDGELILSQSKVEYNSVSFVEVGDLGMSNMKELTSPSGSGGGISSMSGNIYIQESSVSFNTSFNSGGILQGLGNITITDKSTINFNQSFTPADAAGGGGITISVGSVFVSNSSICFNTGLGMYSSGIVSLIGDVIITDQSILEGNINAGPGGSIACNFNGSINISGKSKIIKNTGASLGGAIVNFSLKLGLISISGCSVISDNILNNAQSIGQTIDAFLRVIFSQLDSVAAQATLSGGSGGQKFLSTLPDIKAQGLIIQEELNKIPQKINGIDRNHLIGGGAIAGLISCPILISGDSLIKSNFAGKIVSKRNLPLNALGGAIFGLGNAISITRSEIVDNICTKNGGGIWTNNSVIVDNSSIRGNKILGDELLAGGGLYISESGIGTIIGSKIDGNRCTSARSIGGGIFNDGSTLTLISSEIKKNYAREFPNIFSVSRIEK